MVKIFTPIIKTENNIAKYEAKIESEIFPGKIWYEVDEKFADFISKTNDAALAALIIPAMHYGEDIVVEGKISENLLFNLNNDIQTIYGIFHPHLKRIKVHADNVYSRSYQTDNVATGFSGGVDSFFTLANHFFSEDVSPGYKITHLLYNNVGSHGRAGQRLWQMRYNHLRELPQKYGIPFIAVNSNLDQFYPNYSFLQTHTPRDASVALLLQNGIGKYLYSSSINYHHLTMSPKKPITFSDSIVLPRLSTSSIQMLSAGSDTSRVHKIIRISDLPDAKQLLDVCIDETNEENCSMCSKCMKTQLTLDIAGKLGDFSKVFDRKKYEQKRIEFISSMHRSKLIHHKEILELARVYNYHIPLRTWFFSYLKYYGIRKRLRKALKFLFPPKIKALMQKPAEGFWHLNSQRIHSWGRKKRA